MIILFRVEPCYYYTLKVIERVVMEHDVFYSLTVL